MLNDTYPVDQLLDYLLGPRAQELALLSRVESSTARISEDIAMGRDEPPVLKDINMV